MVNSFDKTPTEGQMAVLVWLYNHRGERVECQYQGHKRTAIGDGLGVGRDKVGGHLEGLLPRGLVCRSRNHGEAWMYRVTPAGVDLAKTCGVEADGFTWVSR